MEQKPPANYILGLDLGVSSIGFAVVRSIGDQPGEILKLGVRIIPLSKDDETEFTQGNAISKNMDRTLRRTQRKGLDRYQLRRKALIEVLTANNMMPDRRLLLELSPLEIWGLRAKAVTDKVSLQEVGRILLHLNQKRGYKHSKSDEAEDKKQTEYVQEVNERFASIKERSETIGQHFYAQLQQYFSVAQKTAPAYRIKEKVFPRAAYIEEFDAIWKRQQQEHPSVLSTDLYNQIRNEIIYYQRRLKSQKGLVNFCEFESQTFTTPEGKSIVAGPRVAPKSSPLFQIEKIWESINNILIKNRKGELFEISAAHRQGIFDHLNNNDRLTQTDLYKILGIGRNDGYFTNELIRKKGIQGNITRMAFAKILGSDHPSLQLNLLLSSMQRADTTTGEVTEQPVVDTTFEKEPLFRLWHIMYSLDEENCQKKLAKEFGFDEITARKLSSSIDLTKGGFGNKSTRAMRKILPYLMEGYTYDKACTLAGYSHSDSLTKEENERRELQPRLSPLRRNSLRQPVVEKILNQMINLVNAIIDQYGTPSSIRVELARELRQSREERNDAYNNINKQERENKKIETLLFELPYFQNKKSVSKRDIEKYRLWAEFRGISPYEPGKSINLSELYSNDYDIEHILPRALRFDDSFGNKTICPRRYNSGENAKNRSTAYDYMQYKRSKEDFESYLTLLESAYNDRRISKSKYEKLLMKEPDIPNDFISRQLNDTRYISRKAIGLLSNICRNVYSTSGSITQRLRTLWGWDQILEQLNLPKYQQVGLTEERQITRNGQMHVITRIKNWSKRDDHRHHAIDALVIACTKQKLITRINALNAQHTREEILSEIAGIEYKNKLSLLDNYLFSFKPFDTAEIARNCENINISFKPGKKVATFSIRKIKKGKKKVPIQRHIITPRGPLSEESVYGKIKRKITRTVKLDKSFLTVDNIADETVKLIIRDRLSQHENEPSKAFGNLKKDPIWTDGTKTKSISQVDIFDYVEEYVIKYDISNITAKDVQHIVDKRIREILADRLQQYGDNHKEAFKTTVWLNEEKKIPIKRVRCYTGLKSDSVVLIKVSDKSWGIEYEKYVKPGNNHHIAIYKDRDGKLQEHVVSLWHAVERKKYGLPVVIKDPSSVWTDILNKRELPNTFLENLPSDNWKFQTSMQQNECFVFNMNIDELKKAIQNKEYKCIAPNIFRVRKLTSGGYWFNQQFETTPRESLEDKRSGRCIQASLTSMSGIKARINTLGEIFLE
ncbi:MAG: type II CRISPR RNA-guided endonuclease Cas9 [Chitinophagaceae bacterium]|nr:type II CRISPR RNA-guided endonuclease Cas9 [Chitinophagaceae bacterium]